MDLLSYICVTKIPDNDRKLDLLGDIWCEEYKI